MTSDAPSSTACSRSHPISNPGPRFDRVRSDSRHFSIVRVERLTCRFGPYEFSRVRPDGVRDAEVASSNPAFPPSRLENSLVSGVTFEGSSRIGAFRGASMAHDAHSITGQVTMTAFVVVPPPRTVV